MTLCLAWKQGNEIFFTSDSRLTDPNYAIVTNDATKIFKIDVRIFGPSSADNPGMPDPLLHETTFGMCFSGSFLNGSIIVDTIEEVLSNIQGSPQYSDFSINNLIDIALSIYRQISIQLMGIHRQYGLSTVLIGGYCPINNDFHLYQFKSRQETPNSEILFEKNEINFDEANPYMIGDQTAQNMAANLFGSVAGNYTYFHLMREIIRNQEVPTVGGNIQAGKFNSTEFKTYGIAECEIEHTEHGPQIKDKYKFRGHSIDFSEEALSQGNISIRKNLFNPFQHERDEHFADIMKNHWGVD